MNVKGGKKALTDALVFHANYALDDHRGKL
jgi:hypothetical protein